MLVPSLLWTRSWALCSVLRPRATSPRSTAFSMWTTRTRRSTPLWRLLPRT
nr:MAG TPA: hypothetical protein [Caudoviricetes sp.]